MKAERNSESGFALLFVYAMAATVAIMLYMQLPRVAFEAQRDKEQLLIDRGQQYARAVQLYVRKFQRYPVDMAALENTQNIRFLRKQYVDPMTGKNEWRLIHVGPGGVFTDSKVYGTQQKKDQSAPQTAITELQPFGTGANVNEGVNLATRRRPSDQAGAPGDPNNPASNIPGQQTAPGAISGPVMVLPDGRIVAATTTGVPAPAGSPGLPGQPATSIQPGQPAFPGQQGLQSQTAFPGQPGQPGQPLQGGLPNGFQNQPNAPPSGAANLINQILTTPRPQPGQPSQAAVLDPFGNPVQSPGLPNGQGSGNAGSPGLSPSPSTNTGVSAGTSLGGQVVGGGIAGVASKHEQEGIKLFHDRSSYNQWEFVYDMSKDLTRTGGQQTQAGNTTGQPAGSTAAGNPASTK